MGARSLGAAVAALVIAPVLVVLALAGFVATESRAACGTPNSAPATASKLALETIPANLLPLYVGAAQRFELGPDGWAWLAAINEVETDFGRDVATSSAGAIGWMQFEPETWSRYGISAEGNGPPNPDSPADAIYSAANYLHASGAPANWAAAVFAYNHASWYVAQVAADAESFLATPAGITVVSEAPAAGREDPTGPNESPALTQAANAAGPGVTVTGPGITFEGGQAGIEVRDAATVGQWWSVMYPDGHTVVLKQLAVGPASTGTRDPVLASDAAALAAAGYADARQWPRGGLVSAVLVGASATAAPEVRGAGCMSESANATVARIEAAANQLAAMKVPYVYGGGHGTPAVPNPGLDCSSSVSWVLQHAGIAVPTLTSGEYMTWGAAGPGAYVTLYANAGHVFIAIRPSPSAPWRYFGTSGFGHPNAPNGTGPAWFTVTPAHGYLAGFVVRHPGGL